VYNDFTGSISGSRSSIVSALPHMVTDSCYDVPSWSDVGAKAVCPHKFMSVIIDKSKQNLYNETILQRGDMLDKPFRKYDGHMIEGENKADGAENMYFLNADFSHIISILHPFSNTTQPKRQLISFKFRGADEGVRTRVGLCLPRKAEIEVKRFTKQQPVENFEDLEKDFENKKFYHDKNIDVVFFMVTGNEKSTIQIGDTNRDLEQTRKIHFTFRVKGGGIGDCRERVEEIKEGYEPQVAPITTPKLEKPSEDMP